MIEEARREELTTKLRNGGLTRAEEEEVAEGHLRYIVHIAGRYALAFPDKLEEMVAEGARAIVWVLRHPEKMYNNNISGFIASKTHNFISKFLRNDHVFGPSCALQEKRISAGKTSGVLACHTIDELNGVKDYQTIWHTRCNHKWVKSHLVIQKHVSQLEVDEIIEKITITEEDKVIYEMRSHQYNDREISEKIGKSNSYVHKARTEMQKRYQRLVG